MSAEPAGPTPEELARRIASVALDKKARDVVVLDMRGVVSYTDFLVIGTGNTERQTHAIEDAIYQDLKHGEGTSRIPQRVEGASEGRWILMDYLDCIVHIFTPAAREYYRLETLWGEVPALEVREAEEAESADRHDPDFSPGLSCFAVVLRHPPRTAGLTLSSLGL